MAAQASRHMTDFFIAGMRYWDGALVLDKLAAGKKLKMKPEPDNPYDPDAVALYWKKTKLGYIPRTENALYAQLLRFGHADIVECRIIGVDPQAKPWEQVRVGIYIADAAAKKN